MNFKRLAVVAALGSATFSGAALAEFSANVGVVSEYFYRGVLQTGTTGTPSVSGGLDWASESGFYVGTWAATTEGFAGGLEWDVYAGFAGEAGSVSYDVGVFMYGYPEAGTNDTVEFYASAGIGPATLTYNYSDDWFGSDLSASYLNLAFSFGLSDTLALDFGVGYSFGDAFDGVEYTDYIVSLTKSLSEELSATFAVVGTDDSDVYGDPRFTVGVTYSFGL